MIQLVLDQHFLTNQFQFHFLLTHACVTPIYLISFGVTFTPYSI